MTHRKIVMGLDTSNYTTSVALLYSDGELIANIKCPLPVAIGECGLRQSDAVFAHIKNIPIAMSRARGFLEGRTPAAIGVSSRPRNVEGSYMPVFLAGVAAAESIGASLGIPVYKFSHQCGHIMAALYSSDRLDLVGKQFAAFHVSGGTTELVKVDASDGGFNTELVGGTLDLNAGQVIDRIGVKLGMPFPAGAHLEQAALLYHGKISRKNIPGDGMHVNLSGLENMADKLYLDTADVSYVGAFVFDYIARSIEKMATHYIDKFGNMPIVCAGGVMCNSIIKDKLKEKFDVYFAVPDMSSDNAVGTAMLGRNSFCASVGE